MPTRTQILTRVRAKRASPWRKIELDTPSIVILSGPGGVGKTTLLQLLLRKKTIKRYYVRAITATTRSQRDKEKHGRDYLFFTKEKFLKLLKKNFFLEHQKVLDNYYGTPKKFYEDARREKKNLLLCIDVKGAMYLKKHFKLGKIVAIFIAAPHRIDLYKRLKRRTEAPEVIRKRIALAKKEMKFIKQYDYVVVNDRIKEALKILEMILLQKIFRRN